MAEPFSLAASGVALIHLGVKVYKLCDDYCNVVKESEQDFKKLGEEIRSIDRHLKEIQSLAAQGDSSNPQYPELLEWTRNTSLKDYKIALEGLEKKLDVPDWRKSSRKLFWPFSKPKMVRYLGLVAEQRSKLHLLLTTATTKTVTKVLKKLDENKLQEVQKWLNVVDPASNYSSALAVREPGTGGWLLGGAEYIDWKEGRGGVLWLHGIPGCGKSVLSATAIQDVENLCEASNDHALAYFYFTFSDSEKQKLSNMLLSLIGQLPKRPSDQGLPGEVVDLYNSTKAIGKSADTEALKVLLSQIIRGFRKTFIVLDALDEVPKSERKDLLSWLHKLTADHNLESLSILITSRPEADIVRSVEPLATFSIPLQSKTIDPDIRFYIRNSLDSKDEFQEFTKEIKSEIEETLVTGSQGMFRWVDCLLRILETCIAPDDVRAALKKLPKDLDSVYARILESIDEMQRIYIQRAMNWLTFSAEPLTLGQLAEAVRIEYDVDKYGEDSKPLFNVSSLMSICPSLISFEDARHDEFSSQESRRLRLAHFSVKEYLVSDRAAEGPSAYYRISEDEANLVMGHACLSRILRHSAQGTIRRGKVKTSFLYHSARYWFVYIRSVEDTAPTPLSDAALKVLELGKGWLGVYDPDDPYSDERSSDVYPPAIYYSSLLNLVAASKLLVHRTEDTVNVNAQGGKYGNALQAAAIEGNESVVRLLLERGVDVNAQGGQYGHALQAAASGENESVAQLLLEYGAEANAQGGHFGNALQAAAYRGNDPIARLLLDRGAEVNAQGGFHGNALQAAAILGNEWVVRLLLERGAEVNAQDGRFGNALQEAAREGNGSLVLLLLDHGAEVNAQGGFHGNALQAATYRGNGSVVRLLLERGADVNAQGGQYVNALQAAAVQGNESVVWLLLERGAEVNAQDGHFGNALQAAAREGNESLVRLLLDHGAEVNAQGGFDGNALQAAAYRGNGSVVRLLLERGAEVNAQGGQYGSALQAAAVQGNESVVRLLLERGAEVNAQDGHFGNALQAAARKGNESVVRLLLDHGAEVNAQGGFDRNALQAAAYRGNGSVVRLLLERGADVNAQGGHALQAAARKGNESIVHLLLAHGAEVNAQGGFHGNALQAAAVRGNEPIVHLLLERGAEVNSRGGAYGNALQAAAYEGDESVVQLLLEHGAEVNAQGGEYGNALQAAAYRGNESVVWLLLERGAEVNAQGGEYGNALQAAAYEGNESVALLLLERGAEVNAQGGAYGNALRAAKILRHESIVQLLLAHTADPNALNVADDTSSTAI